MSNIDNQGGNNQNENLNQPEEQTPSPNGIYVEQPNSTEPIPEETTAADIDQAKAEVDEAYDGEINEKESDGRFVDVLEKLSNIDKQIGDLNRQKQQLKGNATAFFMDKYGEHGFSRRDLGKRKNIMEERRTVLDTINAEIENLMEIKSDFDFSKFVFGMGIDLDEAGMSGKEFHDLFTKDMLVTKYKISDDGSEAYLDLWGVTEDDRDHICCLLSHADYNKEMGMYSKVHILSNYKDFNDLAEKYSAASPEKKKEIQKDLRKSSAIVDANLLSFREAAKKFIEMSGFLKNPKNKLHIFVPSDYDPSREGEVPGRCEKVAKHEKSFYKEIIGDRENVIFHVSQIELSRKIFSEEEPVSKTIILIDRSESFGFKEFEKFVKMGELIYDKYGGIDLSQVDDLLEWKFGCAHQDSESLSLKEIDLSKIELEIPDYTDYLSMMTFDRYLERSNDIQLDVEIFQKLWENQDSLPDSWKEVVEICEYISVDEGKGTHGMTKSLVEVKKEVPIRIIFAGTVFANSGCRGYKALAMYYDGIEGRWRREFVSFDRGIFGKNDRIAAVAGNKPKTSRFVPHYPQSMF